MVDFPLNTRDLKLWEFILCKQKNPHSLSTEIVENYVDNVDNLLAKQVFAHFYYISGPHSYQQVAVHTIF